MGPGLFRVEVADQLRRALEVGKQHRDLLALTLQGPARGENLFRKVWRRVGERRWFRLQRGWGRRDVSRPDQHFAIFIAGKALGVDKFIFERCEVVVIQVKLGLERPV